MTTTVCSLLAVMASLVLLAPLAMRDPKRLRAAIKLGGAARAPMPDAQRKMLGWASLVPGVLLALVGEWPAFLIWLGAATATGWALAQGLAPRPQ